MSLAYGVNGEIDLELENNYGNYSDWTKEELMGHINETLHNMLTFADDKTERKEIRSILNSRIKQEKIAKDFIESHKEGD